MEAILDAVKMKEQFNNWLPGLFLLKRWATRCRVLDVLSKKSAITTQKALIIILQLFCIYSVRNIVDILLRNHSFIISWFSPTTLMRVSILWKLNKTMLCITDFKIFIHILICISFITKNAFLMVNYFHFNVCVIH